MSTASRFWKPTGRSAIDLASIADSIGGTEGSTSLATCRKYVSIRTHSRQSHEQPLSPRPRDRSKFRVGRLSDSGGGLDRRRFETEDFERMLERRADVWARELTFSERLAIQRSLWPDEFETFGGMVQRRLREFPSPRGAAPTHPPHRNPASVARVIHQRARWTLVATEDFDFQDRYLGLVHVKAGRTTWLRRARRSRQSPVPGPLRPSLPVPLRRRAGVASHCRPSPFPSVAYSEVVSTTSSGSINTLARSERASGTAKILVAASSNFTTISSPAWVIELLRTVPRP